MFFAWPLTIGLGFVVIYYAAVWFKRAPPPNSGIDHGVLLILLPGCAFGLVQIYRLLTYQAPSTPWEEAIFLSATRFKTVLDIYSPAYLQHPPYWLSIYSPL